MVKSRLVLKKLFFSGILPTLIVTVPLPRPRDDLAKIRGSDEFAQTRYHIWQALHASTQPVH